VDRTDFDIRTWSLSGGGGLASHPFSLRIRDGYRETGSLAVTPGRPNKKKKELSRA